MEELLIRKNILLKLIINIIPLIVTLSYALWCLITNNQNLDISLFLLVLPIIPAILTIPYFYHYLINKVFVDKNKKEIVIYRFGKETIIHHEDIVLSFCVRVDPNVYWREIKFPSHRYIALILKERKRFYITCLLCEPELIIEILNLNPKIIYNNFPFIDPFLGSDVLTTKEFEKKVLEFENDFKDHSFENLKIIINNKNDYAEYAVEAAKRIIKNKHYNIQ